MRTAAESKRAALDLRAQRLAAKLTPAMIRAMLTARPLIADDAGQPSDELYIPLSYDARVATVVALMSRGLCLDGRAGNDHRLTDLGYDVHIYLEAMRADGRL